MKDDLGRIEEQMLNSYLSKLEYEETHCRKCGAYSEDLNENNLCKECEES